MKVLRIIFENGQTKEFIVSEKTASWEGWNIVGSFRSGTLRFRHSEGVIRLPLGKINLFNILNKNIELNANPLNDENYYEDPLS